MVDGLVNKKIAFIIQARMKSTRLPGKILMNLPFQGNDPILRVIINTLKKSKLNPQLFVATSINSENDSLVPFCEQENVICFRGSEDDVLSRFISITDSNNFDIIVRLTADNPFLDIEILDFLIQVHCETGFDYTFTDCLPLGMNFEIVDAKTLSSLKFSDLSNDDKEHVTLFIKNSGLFKIQKINPIVEKNYSSIRLTVDYPSDYLVASSIYALSLKTGYEGINLVDYCLKYFPWVFEVNRNNFQKISFINVEDEFQSLKPILREYDFKRILNFLETNL